MAAAALPAAIEGAVTRMSVEFTMQERLALYGLLAENSTDIILKTDCRGFVLDASPAFAQLGLSLPAMLIGPHLRDLVHPAYSQLIEAEHRAAMEGCGSAGWLELPALPAGGGQQWYEVQIRRLADHAGRTYGALVVMRCIAARKSLEERLFAARYTDPLTQLTNRIAFVSMLDHLVGKPGGGCVALFDIDHFMTLNMRHGQSAGDDLLCAFADLLRTMTRREDIISRIDGERFGVLMPWLLPAEAAELCQPVVDLLVAVSGPVSGWQFPVTASVGIAPIGQSTDSTVKRAEIALFMAKAKGRSRVESDHGETVLLAGCA